MKRFLIPIAVLLAASVLHAAPEEDPVQKLREQLRSALLQLRTAQTDAANHQAAQVAAEAKSKELEAAIDTLEKQNEKLSADINKEKLAKDETIAKLNNQLAEREKRISRFSDALDKWKAGFRKAADLARAKEDERAKLADEAIDLKHTITDLQAKNIALFNTANEILDRYKNYALGKALAAREPFIGKIRVKIENLVQGYKDKIIDNRLSANKPKP